MNPVDELDQLNLDPIAKTHVAAMLQALLDQAKQVAKIIQAKEAVIHTTDVKIAALTHELAYYKRIRFSTKSEALAPLQRNVLEETWNTDISAIEAEVEQLQETRPGETVVRPKRPGAGRQPLPAHMPRIEHRHEPESCTCGQCGKDLIKIGDDCRDAGGRIASGTAIESNAGAVAEDISEQLDVESAQFFVHRHSRPQYACRACETITAAPIPPAVIQTLLGIAKLNGLDPSAWLKETLEKLPIWPNSRIDELLPFHSAD